MSHSARQEDHRGGVEGGSSVQFSFAEAFDDVTASLPARSRDILRRRFGVSRKAAYTLEAIGQKYGITRERVRQIVKTGVESARGTGTQKNFGAAQKRILCTIEAKSGIIKEDVLLEILGAQAQQESGAVMFFIAASDAFAEFDSKKQPVHKTIVTKSFDQTAWETLHKEVVATLKKHGVTLSADDLFDALYAAAGDTCDDRDVVMHYIDVSREIETNPFGKWGLATWDDIMLKGIREKVYLVVKEKEQPMHFREIAEAIDYYNLNKKGRSAHPQTVHNELIKDDRFVLVGRGIYALKDWGYNTGTVRDVVQDVLEKEQTPMHQDDILSHVLRLRKVKKSTVLINLHNFFERVDHDRYTVK